MSAEQHRRMRGGGGGGGGPEALLVQLLCYVRGSCYVINTLKPRDFPERCSGVTWRVQQSKEGRTCGLQKKTTNKNQELIKSQNHGPLGIERQHRSGVFTHRGE